MAAAVTLLRIRWDGVPGATGYEIVVDGRRVATTGPKARTTNVSVGQATKVAVVDLPARSLSQTVEFSQVPS